MRSIILFSLCSILPSISIAITPPPPPAINPAAIHTMHHSSNVTNPATTQYSSAQVINTKGFSSANQYYENSVDGLRDYVGTLKSEKPEIYQALDRRILILEEKQFKAKVATWTSGGVGVALIIAGMTVAQEDESVLHGETREIPNVTLIGIGTVLAALGPTLARSYLGVNQRDIRSVVNEHNRLNPTTPLNFSIGFNPSKSMPQFSLAFPF